jgi:hypothetical protein
MIKYSLPYFVLSQTHRHYQWHHHLILIVLPCARNTDSGFRSFVRRYTWCQVTITLNKIVAAACEESGFFFFTIPGHLRSWSVALTHSVSYTFCFSFYRPRWPYFFCFIPFLVPSVNWIGHEAAILPSMCEYSNPNPDLIKLPHQILLDIRTDSCLYSVGPSYKMTNWTAGPPIFDTSVLWRFSRTVF